MSVRSAISGDEIRARYFGEAKEEAEPTSTGLTPLSSSALELTPSAKYVVREAKKRMGQNSAFGDRSHPSEDELLQLVRTVETSEGEELSERERTAVLSALAASLEHYDILSPLLENADINDIIVRSYKDISIQINRRNIQTDLRFPDEATYRSFVENLLKRAGKSCTVATPVVDAALDPHVRACVTHESFSPPGSGPMLTLRVSRHRAISLDALVQFELAPRIILEYLAALVRDGHATVLIAGEVGSGKTTLVKALASRIHEHEAILIIEDTHEVAIDRQFVRTLLTREANTEGAGRISPAVAIRTGMRMAMNRVILGEMRDAEAAEAFIDVCASGHSGMSTIHARSARDALARLELFLARAQGNVSIETIRRQIANALSIVIYIDVDPDTHKRRIFEVLEVGTSADGVVQVSPMFSYTPHHGLPEWTRGPGVSQFPEALQRNNVRLPIYDERISLDPEHLYRVHASGLA